MNDMLLQVEPADPCIAAATRDGASFAAANPTIGPTICGRLAVERAFSHWHQRREVQYPSWLLPFA